MTNLGKPGCKECAIAPGKMVRTNNLGYCFGCGQRVAPAPAGFVIHELKTWPAPFAAIRARAKKHEIREDDRGYQVGDHLRLQEWIPRHDHPDCGPLYKCYSPDGRYSGEVQLVRVTHIDRGPSWGLPEGVVVMSIL